jgi:hypoxanthine phosphoribosyltransferase
MNMKIRLHDLDFVPMMARKTSDGELPKWVKNCSTDWVIKIRCLFVVLNGAFMFAADLVRAYNAPCEMTFVRLSSYSGTSSSGTVTTSMGLDTSIAGRHLVVVEDIIDTGRTLHAFLSDTR